VQKDAVANIALSPEETKVLEAARQARGAFPLFINGRAGSGKSTLLQYIFAEHLHRYFQQEQDAGFKPPLYLTCSSDLLKHSRDVVEKLLKCNASFLSAGEPVPLGHNHRPTLEAAFQEFRPFLLTHLQSETRLQKFRPSHRVDFAQFRRLWQRKFGNDAHARKHFGPDISWHIIRTYIKGMSAESYQDPDDYRQFDTKERLVANDTFDEVFKKVWDNWYRPMCEDSGYWDDQDLARMLIEQDLIKAEHPAIFCDEAQDFTRLELEMILRLCLFSNRAIAPQQIGCIPLVFAGDPFQTLNPTGFRWEATKAAFVEKFVLSLDPNRRSGMDDLNYRELTYNYRSSRNIVLFSNLTQALRCRLFDLRQVNPQEPWAAEKTSPPVVWFDAADGTFWERLRKERGVTIIVPCGEGEELEFVQQHLSKWIRLDDKGVPLDVNVFSAGRAKGLEFDRVAVFGFGDYIQEDVLAPLRGVVEPMAADKSLPIEYFINRLYVAVSRPKRRLFVVDSSQGRKRLWEFATNQQLEEAVLRELHDGRKWEGKVGGMVDGTLGHLDTDEAPNLEEEAKNIEAQGLSRSDPYLLRSASNRYRLAGVPAKAAYCAAEALFVDESYAEAGRALLDCGHPARAVDAFWRDGRSSDKPLMEAAAAKPELQTRLEVAFANFLVAPSEYSAGFAVLSKLADRVANPAEAIALAACSHWTDPTRRVAEKIVELGETQKDSPDWSNLSATLGKLDAAGFGFKPSLRARVCYLAGDWANAVSLWESANDKSSKEYREAKARVAPYPERLTHLKELGKNDVILEAFAANPNVVLDAEAKRIVGMALLSAKRFREALELLVSIGAIAELADLAATASISGERDVTEKAIRLCAVLVVQQSHWASVREYLNSGNLPRASRETQKTLAPVLDGMRLQFDRLLAVSFARSDSLTKLDSGEQKPISKFLRDFEKSKYWQTRISVKELGAAIERSQRFVDAIEFYESILPSAQSDDEKRFAIVRWVKSKERLETFYRGEKQHRRADEIREEIARVKTTHAVKPAELAVEYPELDTLNELLQRELVGSGNAEIAKPVLEEAKEEVAKEEPVPASPIEVAVTPQPSIPRRPDAELVVGQLKLKLSRENKRINLEHQTTSKTSTIRLSPVACTSEDVKWTASKAGTLHECEEWGLKADFSKLESERLVVVRVDSAGVQISFETI
jgi:tetratricopeptide (TPR) repeat protein